MVSLMASCLVSLMAFWKVSLMVSLMAFGRLFAWHICWTNTLSFTGSRFACCCFIWYFTFAFLFNHLGRLACKGIEWFPGWFLAIPSSRYVYYVFMLLPGKVPGRMASGATG